MKYSTKFSWTYSLFFKIITIKIKNKYRTVLKDKKIIRDMFYNPKALGYYVSKYALVRL